MDIKHHATKITGFIKKYKYAVIVLMIGIALMLIPSVSNSNDTANNAADHKSFYTEKLDEDLAQILSKVDGAGKVEVILTVSQGEQKVYQTNTSQSGSDQNSSYKKDTVIISNSSRNEDGLILRIDPVKYLGAIVLCQGADRPAVKLAVTEAVSKITGLGTDRICVLKMK